MGDANKRPCTGDTHSRGDSRGERGRQREEEEEEEDETEGDWLEAEEEEEGRAVVRCGALKMDAVRS